MTSRRRRIRSQTSKSPSWTISQSRPSSSSLPQPRQLETQPLQPTDPSDADADDSYVSEQESGILSTGGETSYTDWIGWIYKRLQELEEKFIYKVLRTYEVIRKREMGKGFRGWFRSDVGGEVEDVGIGEKVIKRRRAQKKEMTKGEGEHFPGMVNLSGTLCYMNSVLQAFASLPSLVHNLDTIIALAVEVDLPTPVTDTLSSTLQSLNTPSSRVPKPIRPISLLQALEPLPQIRRLLSTREQQDAHELFVVLAEAVSDEAMKVAIEFAHIRGLGEVLTLQEGLGGGKREEKKKRGKIKALQQPWEGLMARRRVCKRCGWCEAVRMDTLGGMELPIPLNGDISLDACIAEYLAPENLSDVTCEMCSLRLTQQHYASESSRLSLPPNSHPSNDHQPIASSSRHSSGSFSPLSTLPTNATSIPSPNESTSSRKKKAREASRIAGRLQEMLDSGVVTHFNEPLPPTPSHPNLLPIKWLNSRGESLRQAAIIRPPQSLRLHFIRSEYTPYGTLLKKTARVNFPIILDLTRFVARGVWEERTSVFNMLQSSTNVDNNKTTRVLYRLESAILHYGYTHSSGHFICIRRKPIKKDGYKPIAGEKNCQDWCTCDECRFVGPVREEIKDGKGWLRISDDDVEEVGEEALIESRGAIFMLFYEKVKEYKELSRPNSRSSEKVIYNQEGEVK
ncbi:hypothetical protein M231_07717 [Tremella mesenterica]|uniref:ubiquitinyl hydrolase 1 n=1 Tax=Tremella mesenterica TaxID=5217 RepID=A0A4Q1BBI2_TREME|nr:hypothetical protein M231_07717 [Tremella mesenterica]